MFGFGLTRYLYRVEEDEGDCMFRSAVGQSEDPIYTEALAEIFEQIEVSLGEDVPQAGIMFCPLDSDFQNILVSIRSKYPSIELIGCTTDGEISSVNGFAEDSIVLIVFLSDTIEFRAGAGENISLGGVEGGKNAAASAKGRLSRFEGREKFAVVLTDPLNAGVSDVDKGIAAVFGENFPMIGAASAAHSKKRQTFQFCNDQVLKDSIVLLLFAGNASFSCGIKGGHAPMGGKSVVTSVKRNILYRIDNETAYDYFSRYVGADAGLFMNYCLAVFEPGRDSFYVRSAPFTNKEDGTVTLNGVVPEGSLVQMGTADKDTCVESCETSIQTALSRYSGNKPAAVLFISCAGRKMMLGTQVVKEAAMAKKYFPDVPFVGLYSYGEIGPLENGGKSLFHGTTFITLIIGEEYADSAQGDMNE